MSSLELSIVVPVYNNASTLPELLDRIIASCERCCTGDFECILVNDGSVDASWTIISAYPDERVRGLSFARNFGQHSALKAAFAAAAGQYVIMMDADLEEQPEVIEAMLPILKCGTDICFTAYSDNYNRNGRVTSRIFHRLSSYLTGTRTSNNMATMRGFNRTVLGAILKYGERRPVYGPLIAGLGFTSETLLVELPNPKGQVSSYTFGKRLRLAGDYLIGYTNIPSAFFMVASALAFLGTLTYSAVITFQYLFLGSQLPPGISLMIVLILLLFSILFLGIAIIGLYLKRLLEETLSRPLYVVAATHRLDGLPQIGHRPD